MCVDKLIVDGSCCFTPAASSIYEQYYNYNNTFEYCIRDINFKGLNYMRFNKLTLSNDTIICAGSDIISVDDIENTDNEIKRKLKSIEHELERY